MELLDYVAVIDKRMGVTPYCKDLGVVGHWAARIGGSWWLNKRTDSVMAGSSVFAADAEDAMSDYAEAIAGKVLSIGLGGGEYFDVPVELKHTRGYRPGQAKPTEKRGETDMRPSCLLCVRKHLGKAEALMNEVRQGYPHHAGLAIGNLSEAADEALADYPDVAAEIRKHWKAYELDELGYEFPTIELLRQVEDLLQEVRLEQREAHQGHGPTEVVSSEAASAQDAGEALSEPAARTAKALAEMGSDVPSFAPSGDQLGEGEIPQATDSMREMAAGLAKVAEDVGKPNDSSITRPLGG